MLLTVAVLGACSAPAAPVAPTKTVHGVLLEVESPSIQRVERFTLRTDDGQELVFSAAPDFNSGPDHAFTPGHMRQHMALAEPVTISYRDDGNGNLVALNATD